MSRDAIETFDVDGVRVHIYHDDDPQHPREDMDNAGEMVCWHRRSNLGDRQPNDGELTALRYGGMDGLERHLQRNQEGGKEAGPVVVLPLALYEHSGMTMWVGTVGPCQFDSGQVGFIFADAPTIQKEWNGDVAAAERYLRACVKTYDEFLTGQVYGYVVSTIEDEDDDDAEGDHLDSCWGFYGLDYCKEEATSQAKYYAAQIAQERAAREATELALMVA